MIIVRKKLAIYKVILNEDSVRREGGITLLNKSSKQPLISIIMPAYNAEKFISESIISVINQTYLNWELIIIDDCSTDNTKNVAKNIIKDDNRIYILENKENLGVSQARNLGISIAQGSWIAFLDSDDIWMSTKLETQIEYALRENMDFIFTSVSYINTEGNMYPGIFIVPDIVDYKKLRKQNVISCSSVLIKKHFFNDVKMENDRMHEDYAVWLRILKKGVIAAGINQPLLMYRLSSDSKSGNKFKTLKMTYKVFRFIKLNKIQSSYYTLSHVCRSVIKYRRIHFS